MVSKAVFCAISAVLGVIPACRAQSALGPKQQAEAHTVQAQEFLKANRPDLAAKEYAAIVALEPENIDAQGNLGVLLFFQGEYGSAAPHLQAALKLRPGMPKIEALLGMCEKRIGRSDEARQALDDALPKLQDGKLRKQVGLELIELHDAAGDLDKAAAVVGSLRRSLPSDPDVLYTSYRVYRDLADETTLRLTMEAPKSARMHQLMAHELRRQGRHDAAIAEYLEALKIDPRTPGLHFELGELYRTTADTKEQAKAEAEYAAAVAANPFDARAECRLGEIAVERSDAKKALAHYSRALELSPDNGEANIGMARAQILLNDTKKAQEYLKRAAKLDPLDANPHYRLGGLYRDQGRMADADREFAEFQRLRKMKQEIRQVYNAMSAPLPDSERAEPEDKK